MNDVSKLVSFGEDTRTKLQEGLNLVANAVKTTLGPKGRTVVITNQFGLPDITKDGVTVAKSIRSSDPLVDAGVQLMRQAADEQLKKVGDATTTTCILTQALVNKGIELIESGVNPIDIKNFLDEQCKYIVDYIKSKAIDIKDNPKLLRSIACISTNNDEILGNMIADAFDQIGINGIITAEESNNPETKVEIVKGMQFERGAVVNHFFDDFEKNQCILIKPRILITEQRITTIKSIVPLLEELVTGNNGECDPQTPILFIAEDFSNEVIENLKANKLKGILNICAVKAPLYGEYRRDCLQDIAILTDGTSVNYNMGLDIKDITINMLGSCEKIIIDKTHTTIVGGKGDDKLIQTRVKQIEKQISETDNETVINICKQRIAKLIAGVAKILVGGTTDAEMRERKDRVDDAICATRAAIDEGVVIGGGMTLINAIDSIDPYKGLLPSVLMAPFNQILYNCGCENNEDIFNKIQQIHGNAGFNAKTGKVGNLLQEGVLDAAKIVRSAVENSISIAGLILTTDCLIVPEPQYHGNY